MIVLLLAARSIVRNSVWWTDEGLFLNLVRTSPESAKAHYDIAYVWAGARQYERARDEAFPEPAADTFLVNSLGRPLDSRNTPKTFAQLVTAAGIKAPPGQRAPRLHDLRHVFTVATLLDWYRDGGDVQARLPVLSTWLGHIDPKSTYWYLSAVPELLALAAARLEPAGQDGQATS